MKIKLAASVAALAMSVGIPSMAAPANDWTGFYVGANAGGAWGEARPHTIVNSDPVLGYFATTSVTSIDANGSPSLNPSGFNGGIQGGYNYQNGALVVGIEADIDALDLSQTTSTTVTYPCCAPTAYTLNQGVKTSWMATVRPRIGWAGDGWLVYGTGGFAFADVRQLHTFSDNFTAPPGAAENGSTDSTKTGWTLGGGVERSLGNGWSVKAEYLYADFGRTTTIAPLTNPTGFTTVTVFTNSAELTTNIVRVGINHRF